MKILEYITKKNAGNVVKIINAIILIASVVAQNAYKPYFLHVKHGGSIVLVEIISLFTFFLVFVFMHLLLNANEYYTNHNKNWIAFSLIFFSISVWYFFQLNVDQLVMTENSTMDNPVFILSTPDTDNRFYLNKKLDLYLGIYFAFNSLLSPYLFSIFCLKKIDDNS